MSLLCNSKNNIRQTILAYLMPKKERSKSRFLNLPSTAQWFEKMLLLLRSIPQETLKQTSLERKILEHFKWILEKQDFLETFLVELQNLVELQTLLKNNTLNELSYKKALEILDRLEDPSLKIPLQNYLNAAFKDVQNSQEPLLLFSDIIESLFGKYKFLAKPNAFSEINRLILLLPTICENITPELVKEAFTQTQNKEVIEFQHEIGDSLLAKRKKAFKKDIHNKQDPAQIIIFPKEFVNSALEHDYLNGQKLSGTEQTAG